MQNSERPLVENGTHKRVTGSAVLGWIGAGLLLASPLVGWLHPALQGVILGSRIPILLSDTPIPLPSHFLPFSFGAVACLIGGVALFSLLFRLQRARLFLGGLTLFLALALIYQMAFSSPFWLEAFSDQNQQYARLISFTKAYLPPNGGVEPGFWPQLSTEGVFDRIIAAWYFLSWGWYAVTLGGCLLILSGCLERRYRMKNVVAVFLILVALCAVPVAPPLAAEYLLGRGDNHQMQGRYVQALSDYRRALAYDSGLSYRLQYHLGLGATYTALNQKNQSEYHLYQGTLLENRGKIREAAFEYQGAMQISAGGMRHVVEDSLEGLYDKIGLQAYQKGHLALAMSAWEKALTVHPDQVTLRYYRAKVLFDLGAYSDAISENLYFLSGSSHRMLNANAYANLGDCYQKLQDPKRAREFYRRSLAMDKDQNARAFMSLTGA